MEEEDPDRLKLYEAALEAAAKERLDERIDLAQRIANRIWKGIKFS